ISLTAGTWLVESTVTLTKTGNNTDQFTAKLWDGTTTNSSVESAIMGAGAGQLSLSALVTVSSTTTYKVSVAADAINGSPTMKAAAPNNGAGNNAPSIRAIKIG